MPYYPMRWFLPLLCMILFSCCTGKMWGQANAHLLDSLTQELERVENPVDRIDVLVKSAKEYRDTDYQQAINWSKEALKLAQQTQSREDALQALMSLAELYTGYTHAYDQAIMYLSSAMQVVDEKGEPKVKMRILQYSAYVYFRMSNEAVAEAAYIEAIRFAEEMEYTDNYSNLNGKLAEFYLSYGKLEAAKERYRIVLEVEQVDGFAMTAPETKVALAQYFELIEDYPAAISICEDAASDFSNNANHRWEAYTWSYLADLQLKSGNPKLALENANKGLSIARKYHLPKEMADNQHKLSTIYDSLGQYREALVQFRSYTTSRDSMLSLEKSAQIADIQSTHELDRKEQEILQGEKERENQLLRSRIIYIIGGGALVIIVLLTLFLFRSYRQKQQVNDQLADRVELKDRALSEVVTILRLEIHEHLQTQQKLADSNADLNQLIYRSSHDLRGPLASIQGLVMLAESEPSPDAKLNYFQMIGLSADRLSEKLDALLQATVIAEREVKLSQIDFEERVGSVLKGLRKYEFAKGIEVELVMGKELSFESDAYMIDLILHNLIENAMQYKRKGDARAFVKIFAKRIKEGISLRVEDNGLGISQDQLSQVFNMFVKTDAAGHSTGMGLYLVKKVVDKMGGTVRLESREGEGTHAIIIIPEGAETAASPSA